MDKLVKKGLTLIFLGGCILLALSRQAAAKPGAYLGIEFPYTVIAGTDFKGESALMSGSEAIVIPKVDSALGVAITVGYSIAPELAYQLTFETATHRGTWVNAAGDIERMVISLEMKRSFLSREEMRPYLSAGFSYGATKIQGGAIILGTGETGDATFTGTGFIIGSGVDYYVSKAISFGFGLSYRLVRYKKAKGIQASGGIEDGLKGDEVGCRLGAAYHF